MKETWHFNFCERPSQHSIRFNLKCCLTTTGSKVYLLLRLEQYNFYYTNVKLLTNNQLNTFEQQAFIDKTLKQRESPQFIY